MTFDYLGVGQGGKFLPEQVTGMTATYETREEGVLFINGIRILVIECKNAMRDEAIAFIVGTFIVNCKAL
jgi:hypothetical protein